MAREFYSNNPRITVQWTKSERDFFKESLANHLENDESEQKKVKIIIRNVANPLASPRRTVDSRKAKQKNKNVTNIYVLN